MTNYDRIKNMIEEKIANFNFEMVSACEKIRTCLKPGRNICIVNGQTYIFRKDCKGQISILFQDFETVRFGCLYILLIYADGIIVYHEIDLKGRILLGCGQGKQEEDMLRMTVSEIEKELGYKVCIVG